MSGSETADARPARRRHHGSHRYDDDLLLKAPVLLWLSMVFLIRHLLLLGITFLPTTGAEIDVLRSWVRPELVLADLPAALLMGVAMRRRRPCADWMRPLWLRGREILSGSVVLYLVLLAWLLWTAAEPLSRSFDEASLISILVCLAIVAYLWRSPLVADVFDDCPVRGDR